MVVKEHEWDMIHLRQAIWIPLVGDFSIINVLFSAIGQKAYLSKMEKLERQEKLTADFRNELMNNKDLLLSAIEEVEQLRA